MPTEQAHALFLFAHQDDEFGVFEQIHVERDKGNLLRACYFTTGAPTGASSAVRNQESVRVLSRLGISAPAVDFIGENLGIADGRLVDHMDKAADWLAGQLVDERVSAVYAPVWEGGHPDHDGLCAVATVVCQRLGMLHVLHHYQLYNAVQCPGPLFRVLAPLAANGPVTRSLIPWSRRFRYLKECLTYRSQWRSWVGLLPFLVLHYLQHGTQALQPACPERLHERPHSGPLYYEKRGFASWEALQARVAAFARSWQQHAGEPKLNEFGQTEE